MNRGLGLIVLAAFLLQGCSQYQNRIDPYRPATVASGQDADGGEVLYRRDCAWCHGDEGEGTELGPDLIEFPNGPALTDFELTTGRMPLGYPSQRVHRRAPAYDAGQIAAIVAYTDSFDPEGPQIPTGIELADAELHLGLELYQDNCAACHSTAGVGGVLATSAASEDGPETSRKANIAPELDAATPTQVAEAMIAGPGNMPVFGYETFSETEIEAIVRYVVYLQEPNNRGGAPIGTIGPVAEGAVAWLIALGLLLVFARWIGTKAGDE